MEENISQHIFLYRKKYFCTGVLVYALALIFLFASFFLISSPAYAANECGSAVAGATVICNNDGTPATDTSPYTGGISYGVPVDLIIDGSVNPINITGRVVSANLGTRSITITGNVNITGAAVGQLIGSTTATGTAASHTITLGEDVTINATRLVASTTFITVWAFGRNGTTIIDSSADIRSDHLAGGAANYTASILTQDVLGGANSFMSITNRGNITTTSFEGSNLIGMGAFMTGAGSSSALELLNTGTITTLDLGGTATGCFGMSGTNNGSGGINAASSGAINVSGNCGNAVYGAIGAYVFSQASPSDLDLSGDITVSSGLADARGVRMEAVDNTASLILASDVSATASLGDAYGVFVTDTTRDYDITLQPTASIIVDGGTGSAGISALAYNGGTINMGAGSAITNAAGATGNAIVTGIGTDSITATGSDITGIIFTDAGNDTVDLTSGSLDGGVETGDGDDIVNITNMANADIATVTHLDGGTGTDELTFTGISHSGGSLPVNDIAQGINLGVGWETINFVNSWWALTGDLTLGGSTVNIDSASTLFAGNGINSVISSVLPGDPAVVNNAGIIDLTNGASGATDTLTIMGNYTGQNGTIILDAVLGNSASPIDKIIIDGSNGGGSATGTTTLSIINNGGMGEITTGNGILVVEAINGATTSSNAFNLLGGSISAGAYTYNLNANANQNWYLASSGYRTAVGVDMAVPALTHQLGIGMLGTLDDRHYVDASVETPGNSRRSNVWARTFGEIGQRESSDNAANISPAYDWTMAGVQTGMDLYRDPAYQGGSRNILGIYVGAGKIDADIASNLGDVSMTGYSAGSYWTHYGRDNAWYTDAVLQGMLYEDIEATTSGGDFIATKGQGFIASLEAGSIIDLDDGLTITPQAQAIYQANDIDDAADSIGRISYDMADAIQARLGIKYAKSIETEHGALTGWVRPSIWHNFNARSRTSFSTLAGTNATDLDGDIGNSWGQIGFGVSADIGTYTSLFASGDYSQGIATSGYSLAGRAGARISW